jgi:hypothetical protein
MATGLGMPKISHDAQHVGKVIAEAINGPNWPAIYAIFGTALISWVGAFIIAKLVSRWDRQTIARSTVAALHAEIGVISVMLDDFATTRSPYLDVVIERIRNDNRLCSVYLASAGGLGHVSKNVVDDIVIFYSSILLLRDAREVTREGKKILVMDRRDLSRLCELAESALSKVEKEYSLTRPPKIKSNAEGAS